MIVTGAGGGDPVGQSPAHTPPRVGGGLGVGGVVRPPVHGVHVDHSLDKPEHDLLPEVRLTRLSILFLARARRQALVTVLKVASLDMKEVKMCFSLSVQTATALGIILAVFSFVIEVTEVISSLILT